MCELLDRVEETGCQIGIRQGINEGQLRKARAVALNLRQLAGFSDPTVVAKLVDTDPATVAQWFSETAGKA